MKRNILFLFLIGFIVLSACEKQMTLGKLNGKWDVVYHKIDGVEQDTTGGVFLLFGATTGGGFIGKDKDPNSSGFLKANTFSYLYFSKKNRLVLIYDTGIREELTLKKIKALPPFLSYDDEETANEEYMILTKENEEWKFVKRWEE
jgi:hypothetical protein